MKAAVYYETGAPDVFRYEDVADPACRPGHVLIEVRAISIEGGDTLHRAGGDMAARPHIVGYQCAGVVREVGAGVDDRKPGQHFQERSTREGANSSETPLPVLDPALPAVYR